MSRFENLFNSGKEKVRKAAKIGTLGLGIGAGLVMGAEKVEAQDFSRDERIEAEGSIGKKKAEINESGEDKIIKPEDYDLSKIGTLDLDYLEEKKSTNPAVAKKIMLSSLISGNIALAADGISYSERKIRHDFQELSSLNQDGREIPATLKESLLLNRERIKKYKEGLQLLAEEKKKINSLNPDQIETELITDEQKEYIRLAPDIFREIESARKEALRLIASPVYLIKLQKEFHCSRAEAREHQRVRMSNVNLANYGFRTFREKKNSKINPESKGLATLFTNKITFFYNNIPAPDLRTFREVAFHEFMHLATNGGFGMSASAANLLGEESFQNNPKSTVEYNDYFSRPVERYPRLKALELDLERLGIKKRGEKFSLEHYKRMMELFNSRQLKGDAYNFIIYTKDYNKKGGYEIFERLFNEIAAVDTDGLEFDNELYPRKEENKT